MITISCISISMADIVLELCYQFLNADFEARKSNCEAHDVFFIAILVERMNSLLVLVC